MSSPETTDSPQVKLVNSFIEGFKERDMDHIAKHLHKDHRRITYLDLSVSQSKPERNIFNTPRRSSIFGPVVRQVTGYCFSNSPPANPPPQITVHSVVEAPGKVVVHVRSQNVRINTAGLNVVPTPQLTNNAKTSIGAEMNREMMLIAHIVTNEDGSPKIKQLEEFTDSKAYLDFFKAVAEANANSAA